MAIGVLNPQIIDSNPFGQGLQNANSFVSGLQNAMYMANQLRYQPQTLAAQLLQQQLANQKSSAELPYAGPQAAAQLALTQAQTPYLNAQTKNQLLEAEKARLLMQYVQPEAQADLAYKQAQTQVMPLQALGQYYGGLGRYGMSNYYNNPLTQLKNYINNPAFLSVLDKNADAASGVTQKLLQVATQIPGTYNSDMVNAPVQQNGMPLTAPIQQQLPQNPINNLIANLTNRLKQNPAFKPYIDAAQQAYGQQQSPSNVPIQNVSPSQGQPQAQPQAQQPGQPTQEEIDAVRDAAAGMIGKKLSTATIQNQVSNLDALMNELNKVDVRPLQQYSGLGGRMEAWANRVKMGLGMDVPKDFREFQNFKDQFVKYSGDTLRQALQTSIVPEYVKSFVYPMLDPTSSIWNDPQQVAYNWNKFKELVNQTLETKRKQLQYGVAGSQRRAQGQQQTGKKFVYDVSTGQFTPG